MFGFKTCFFNQQCATIVGKIGGSMAAGGGGSAPVSTDGRRGELVEEFLARCPKETSENRLAFKILRGEPVSEKEFLTKEKRGSGKKAKSYHVFKPETVTNLLKLEVEGRIPLFLSALDLAALSGHKVALGILCKYDSERELARHAERIQRNTPAHWAALAGDEALAETLSGSEPTKNAAGATPRDILYLTAPKEKPYVDVEIPPKEVLKIWLSGIACNACRLNPDSEYLCDIEQLRSASDPHPIDRREMLEIRAIPGKGEGCFARVDIPKGTLLLKYGGIFYPYGCFHALPSPLKEIYEEVHGDIHPKDDTYIMGAIDGKDSLAGKFNDGYPIHLVAYGYVLPGMPFAGTALVTARDVRAGEEIKYYYGPHHSLRHTGYVLENYEELKDDVLHERITPSDAVLILTTPHILWKLAEDVSLSIDDLERCFDIVKQKRAEISPSLYPDGATIAKVQEQLLDMLLHIARALEANRSPAPNRFEFAAQVRAVHEQVVEYVSTFADVINSHDRYNYTLCALAGIEAYVRSQDEGVRGMDLNGKHICFPGSGIPGVLSEEADRGGKSFQIRLAGREEE